MNIACMGSVSAAEAIGLANQSYSAAKGVGDTAFQAAAAADASGGFDWSVFLANIVRPQIQNTPGVAPAPAKSSTTPYLIAGGAAVLAMLALK